MLILYVRFCSVTIINNDQISGSKLQPRIVELMHAYSKRHDYREHLYIATELVNTFIETTLPH